LAQDSLVRQVAEGRVKLPVLNAGGIAHTLQGISGGTLDAVLPSTALQPSALQQQAAAALAAAAIKKTALGCGMRTSDHNVRVNQDCTFRAQAGALIKINPSGPQNLIAGFNDRRLGLNHCGFAYSLNGGRSWGDGEPPFWEHLNGPVAGHTIAGGPGTGHTYDAASDPGVAFDSAGRAFFSCLLSDVNTNASAVLVTQSPQGASGSFYDNVPSLGSTFVVVEDNSPTIVHDKPFITADTSPGSPAVDNVYATWTVFKFGTTCGAPPDGTLQFCSSAIFGSMSTDHAVTWSQPEEISGSSPLCSFGNFFDPSRTFNACDLDHGPDTQVMPNGQLIVAFLSQNTTTTNNQDLAVTCQPSGSSVAGTAHLNCGSPSKVGDDVIAGEPQCDFGRGPEECVPGPFIKINDFPRLAIDRTNGGAFVVWQDYRNGEYDVQLSRSSDGGATWTTSPTPVNSDTGADHYFAAVGADSTNLAVSFFKSGRLPNENNAVVFTQGTPGVQTASSSYQLAGQRAAQPASPFATLNISPLFAPPDGDQTGFNGDYTGIAVTGSTAHVTWSDTRNSAPPPQGHDEDVFTASHSVP
jgi:hypothetical protein